ncbi:MAG: heparinase II/III family protein [Fimbriimonadaceae bacterium]|nr:heparinase II/III family protein [Fimbriimonadaceae bacterium]
MSLLTSLSLFSSVLAPAPADLLATLRAGHPRLILLDSDLPRLRELTRSDAVAKEWLERQRAAAAKLLELPPTEFKIVGPRLLAASRSVLDRIYTLGLIYRLDGHEAVGRRAVAELRAAARWVKWNPSHFLDTAELNHAFGIGWDWLQPLLGEDRQAIREGWLRNGLQVAAEAYRNKAWWAAVSHNWNQVCNGGNAIAALAIADEEPALAAEILSAAVANLPRALRSYAPDGGWDEGPGYWHYATRYTVYCLAALQTALGTDFGLSELPGLDQAGDFRMYFCGPTGVTFNYADAHAGTGESEELLWLAQRYQKPAYAWEQRRLGGRHALDLVWLQPPGSDPQAGGYPLDRTFRGVDVTFLRGDWLSREATWVAFKGGDNAANHSHLDLGSFVLEAGGQRFLDDPGPDNYNLPGYFGSQRWTYYRLMTVGQNTLLINGANQPPRAKAPTVAFGSTPQRAYGVVDLSAAYPLCREVRRGFALLDRRDVLVVDELTAAEPVTVEWGALTTATAVVDGRRVVLTKGAATLYGDILEPATATWEVTSAVQPPPQASNEGWSRLVARPAGPVERLRLVIRWSPSPEATTPAVGPLSEWIAAAPLP